ncbi:pyridoxine/pyridoxamine 5'-phosphate oxidase [Cellulomonas triticagri]|uniref:Pyridoxal 5'-phosphate synthase n=1 Tax=Cellulomonas triticagri TaxID=2483352 RepID=A0A3M2JLV4_9CELL|nr:pyridoxal 5'-phosphate synthase [Cellulomonas triticagri]RMI12810.1 pyridoxal 5'-phosphate synthase [Cellulomonas triticagri]
MERTPRIADLLRGLPALTGDLPEVDPYALPADPVEAFERWFADAVAAGVPEPHAVTLATAGADARPAARVVLLADVVDGAFVIATDSRAGKSQHLSANPHAALTFYWQPLGRQVRLSGPVHALDAAACAADFLRRSPSARAAALASRPGEALHSPAEMVAAVAEARTRVDRDPRLVLPTWQLWGVVPEVVELWQGDHDRAHLRVRYSRTGGGWTRRLDWP